MVEGPDMFKGTDFEKRQAEPGGSGESPPEVNPFSTPPTSSDCDSSESSAVFASTHRSLANDAFVAAGAKVPCEFRLLVLALLHERGEG